MSQSMLSIGFESRPKYTVELTGAPMIKLGIAHEARRRARQII
jgi:hypothetical protein